MFQKKQPVLYKKQAAVVTDFDADKIVIQFLATPATPGGKKAVYAEQKVREKDIAPLCTKPVSNIESLLDFADESILQKIRETYELLQSDDSTATAPLSFEELCELIYSDFKAESAWFVFKSLLDSVEFSLDENALKSGAIQFVPRSAQEIAAINQKNYEKEHEAEIHASFIERLKKRELLPEDSRFMVEVENVALCRTEKSRTMVEAGVTQTPEKAHQLLLDTGIWDITKNPYPTRYGLSMQSATEALADPPKEDRETLTHTAYAIDAPWSKDPDDAVAFDGTYLWVHIADPASCVTPDSSIDKTARNKGTTLYLPEGAVRMLSESSFADYALGLKEQSPALSFRLLLNDDSSIKECTVHKTVVKVKRLTYQQADEQKESPELKPLFEIARKNAERRKKSGAININMPEIHISVDPDTKKVSIAPSERYESNDMVCEMMLLAGEGAAIFAYNNRIPFPYVSQEAPELPEITPEGLAGEFKILRCMRKRSVGITPAMHCGLGLAFYSQVTSPLRRYGDLIAHQQLRLFLNKERLLDKDTVLERLSQGDAASIAARKASRFSETHWKLIFFLQNPDWTGNAVCIEKKDEGDLVMIESLAMQTLLKGTHSLELNQQCTLKPRKIDIPTQVCEFEVL